MKTCEFYAVPVGSAFMDPTTGEGWTKLEDDRAASDEQLGLIVEFNAADRVYLADTP